MFYFYSLLDVLILLFGDLITKMLCKRSLVATVAKTFHIGTDSTYSDLEV